MTANSNSVFLTAEWRYLAMLNYEIEAQILAPFVPGGTDLDSWNERIFISVVGFLFQNTQVFGVPIPFHRHFEEVNLRFYVRRKEGHGWRRGVVFVKELVPRRAIALAARAFYNENYLALPMFHSIEGRRGKAEETKSVEYSWRFSGTTNCLKLTTHGAAQSLRDGSEQEFITEHYWGYSAQRDGTTLEYRVEHPRWRVWDAEEAELHCDVADLYGRQFCNSLNCKPTSAFLAEGSAVSVF
ncbi:MAG TPA: DUF2071 domain-containing protein [Verrucomicrobiae bacterium]|nr:DUF2071 domain-containing protein [Verrucomicrobiae bacterium]